jgi:hypothetical protein
MSGRLVQKKKHNHKKREKLTADDFNEQPIACCISGKGVEGGLHLASGCLVGWNAHTWKGVWAKESAAGLLTFDIIAKNDELPTLRCLGKAVITSRE